VPTPPFWAGTPNFSLSPDRTHLAVHFPPPPIAPRDLPGFLPTMKLGQFPFSQFDKTSRIFHSFLKSEFLLSFSSDPPLSSRTSDVFFHLPHPIRHLPSLNEVDGILFAGLGQSFPFLHFRATAKHSLILPFKQLFFFPDSANSPRLANQFPPAITRSTFPPLTPVLFSPPSPSLIANTLSLQSALFSSPLSSTNPTPPSPQDSGCFESSRRAFFFLTHNFIFEFPWPSFSPRHAFFLNFKVYNVFILPFVFLLPPRDPPPLFPCAHFLR